jgi:L-iditol 2-dehydrogenase
MKASVLISNGVLELQDVLEPIISNPDQIKIQVKTTGICGSEMHAFKGTHPFRKPPAIMGHEISGIISDVGKNVTQFKPGDRVFIDPQWVCGTCLACRTGHINLCESKKVMGIREWPGGFGEFVLTPSYTVFKLPDQLSFDEGAMLEPLTIATHAVKKAGIQEGMNVLVLGTGSIGTLIAACAYGEKKADVYCADIHQHCVMNAQKHFGAKIGFVLPHSEIVEAIRDYTHGEGIDKIFICADEPDLLPLAISLARIQGSICFIALMTEENLNYDGYAALRKELSIITSYMGTHEDVERSLALVRNRVVDVEKIITHRLPISQAQRAMELAISKDEDAIKVVLVHQ